MHPRSKLLLAAIVATFMLSLAATNAGATKLGVNKQQFKFSWTSLELTTSAGTISCPITMEGSFHYGTFAKTEEALLGHVSRATIATASCTGGTATANQEALPWHLRYTGFEGTLPDITSVELRLVGAKFTHETGFYTCTWQTETTHPAAFTASLATSGLARGIITGLRADEEFSIPLRGNFFCPIAGSGSFAGSGEVTQLGSTSGIRLILIASLPTLSPESYDFGTVEPTRSVERTFTIHANGETLIVLSIGMTTGTSFAISDPNRCVGRLEPGQTCSFTVTFTAPAQSEMEVEDTVVVETTVRRLQATVRGRSSSAVTLEPNPITFGTVEPEELAQRTVTITAAERVRIDDVKVRTGRYFAITDPSECRGRTLEARATCTFNVVFVAPGEAGRNPRDTVVVETDLGTVNDEVEGRT